MVKVSIIIPTYNEEKDIEECLKSLQNQSYKNFEVLVVDDGSTDKTREIVRRYKRVKLVKGQHKGPGFSRNIGAKKANGQILVFIDADMTFDKNYIKNLIKPILENKKIIGTTHDYEIAINTSNKWSKFWGKIRVAKKEAGNIKIFRAIRKYEFIRMRGFDPKYGYADDQTFWYKFGILPQVAQNTTCYHKNPETLKGTFKQARWIGASWKERFSILKIPIIKQIFSILFLILLPLVVLSKSFLSYIRRKGPILDLLKFYSYKFSGYCSGLFKSIFLNDFRK